MKIGNKKELKSIAEKNSGHLDFKDFLKIYDYCTIFVYDGRYQAYCSRNI